MSDKSKIYTRTGDKGETSLFGGERVAKTHQRIIAIGSVDELNAALGTVAALTKSKKIRVELEKIQSDLFSLGSELANTGGKTSIDLIKTQSLERSIDYMDKQLKPLVNFILPGGSPDASQAQLARSISRRAEREVLKLNEREKVNAETTKYLNRLSDFLFVLARYLNKKSKFQEVVWKGSISKVLTDKKKV